MTPERMCAPTTEPFSTTTTERLGVELLQADRGGKARRPGADDDDVVIHRLAGGQFVFSAIFRSRAAKRWREQNRTAQ